MPRSSSWRQRRYLRRLLMLAMLSSRVDMALVLVARLLSLCKRPPRVRCDPGARLDLRRIDPGAFYRLFRVNTVDDMLRLADALRIPDTARGVEALALLLYRLAYPCRLVEIQIALVAWSEAKISSVINCVLDDLFARYKNKIAFDETMLSKERCKLYADTLERKGCPAPPHFFGFIDGTVKSVCRPVIFEDILYTGYKRTHAIKFQGVMTPCGLMASFFGPFPGTHHDARMYHESRVEGHINRLDVPDGYMLYGDGAYPWGPRLRRPFRQPPTGSAKRRHNYLMSKFRQSVEWGFGKLFTIFAFLDFGKNLKVLWQPVGKLCLVACLLCNCHTCLYGCETSDFTGLDPPELEEYV
ncbi:hypothetical protein PTSG_07517 [Salpingoeca rosetta]|uniref:DDE Tnp4 domain-containing protein n=1 Tax=Salpingoeca rosetta (strain ATCC 50818 / BSB-021) TaxID=946362 RepID=F2UGZ8_SALR5|nr:uncharacterized protein PTSG_07517 [Salpingoeca rosetta]EGD76397.1 hypothetical protein PTSG_07517 [Salpingoeca rosetta]|eukprot:XP_004991312.1 hypothetical protein PTSG_07517 [Salpingoeca rosetta]